MKAYFLLASGKNWILWICKSVIYHEFIMLSKKLLETFKILFKNILIPFELIYIQMARNYYKYQSGAIYIHEWCQV